MLIVYGSRQYALCVPTQGSCSTCCMYLGDGLACGRRGCALQEVLSRALPPELADALKPGHAGDICTGDICTCSVHPTGLPSKSKPSKSKSNCFPSACLAVVDKSEC